jgi:hypothetical protein
LRLERLLRLPLAVTCLSRNFADLIFESSPAGPAPITPGSVEAPGPLYAVRFIACLHDSCLHESSLYACMNRRFMGA